MTALKTQVYSRSRKKLGASVLALVIPYGLLMERCGAFRHGLSWPLYAWIAGAATTGMLFGGLAIWRLTLTFTPERLESRAFGRRNWVRWSDIAEMALFRSSVDGNWLWGLRVRPGASYSWSLPAMSRAELNCDIAFRSLWDVGIDQVAATAAEYWKANGGSGEVKDLVHLRPGLTLKSSA